MVEDKKQKHHNKPNRISDAEIIVILILVHSSGFHYFKHYYKEYVYKHLKLLFPRLAPYNRFVELEKEVLFLLSIFIKKVLLVICAGISFVDYTTLRTCLNNFIANTLSVIAAYCFIEKKPAIDVNFINDGKLTIF